MLMIFAAAMATPSSIGATSPPRSPMIIVNNIFIFLVSLKLLVVNRGLGKIGGVMPGPPMLKLKISDETRRLYRVNYEM